MFFQTNRIFIYEYVKSSLHIHSSGLRFYLSGFLSGRRRLDDIQIAASGIDNILAMPHSLIPKNSKVSNTSPAEEFNTNSRRSVQHPQAAKMFREAEDFKEYRILGEDGEERFIQLPLDSEIDPDVFKNLPPKLQYSVRQQPVGNQIIKNGLHYEDSLNRIGFIAYSVNCFWFEEVKELLEKTSFNLNW